MAGFSYQHHHHQQQQPFLLDSESILLPNMEQRNSNIMNCDTNFFSQFCPLDAGALETSCVVHNSDNEPSNNNSAVTKNQSTVSSPEQQVTQSTVTNLHMSKKRKTRNNASSLNSAQSMDPRGVQVKGKKQNKSCNGDDDAMNNRNTEESKNPNDKAEKKKKKKKEELVSEEAPKDYIHVRARRGQATDSHSLAERARREKISERMKVLQRLVPGCDKVTGKAIMLDEIINYVQSLQNQVEFLSMKLASVNPLFYDYGMDLDNALMARPADHNQKLQSIAAAAAGAPATSSPLQCSPTSYQLTAFAHDNHDHHHHHQNINYPNLDAASAATLLLLQGQRPNALISQDNGSSLLWDVEEEQKLKLLDPSVVFSNNLCSFH